MSFECRLAIYIRKSIVRLREQSSHCKENLSPKKNINPSSRYFPFLSFPSSLGHSGMSWLATTRHISQVWFHSGPHSQHRGATHMLGPGWPKSVVLRSQVETEDRGALHTDFFPLLFSQADFLNLEDDRMNGFEVGSPGSWPLSSASLLLLSSWASILCRDRPHLLTAAWLVLQLSAALAPSHTAAYIIILLVVSNHALSHCCKANSPRNPMVLQESSRSCLMCVALSCMMKQKKLQKKRCSIESKWGIVQEDREETQSHWALWSQMGILSRWLRVRPYGLCKCSVVIVPTLLFFFKNILNKTIFISVYL